MVYEKEYGKNHIKPARILKGLGQAYLAEGNLAQAEEFLQKALRIVQKSDHTDSYMVLEDLAQLYLEKSKLAKTQGDTKEVQNYAKKAIDFLNQALDIVKTRFPKDSPHIKRIEFKLKNLEVNSHSAGSEELTLSDLKGSNIIT